jgi:hypothetical protein
VVKKSDGWALLGLPRHISLRLIERIPPEVVRSRHQTLPKRTRLIRNGNDGHCRNSARLVVGDPTWMCEIHGAASRIKTSLYDQRSGFFIVPGCYGFALVSRRGKLSLAARFRWSSHTADSHPTLAGVPPYSNPSPYNFELFYALRPNDDRVTAPTFYLPRTPVHSRCP